MWSCDILYLCTYYIFYLCRSLILAMIVLLPLLGLTWTFGFLSISRSSSVFAWIFTILNSLQVIVCIVLCLMGILMVCVPVCIYYPCIKLHLHMYLFYFRVFLFSIFKLYDQKRLVIYVISYLAKLSMDTQARSHFKDWIKRKTIRSNGAVSSSHASHVVKRYKHTEMSNNNFLKSTI